MDEMTRNTIELGKSTAQSLLKSRREFLEKRDQDIRISRGMPMRRGMGRDEEESAIIQPAGVLVAEGDSWFDYPMDSILKELEDHYFYEVESVAHRGDTIEGMAYDGGHFVEGEAYIGAQLVDFMRRIEKLLNRRVVPKAILLSGGGNDVAGAEFGMLLNHARSRIAGLNASIIDGVINQRICDAYVLILSSITNLCESQIGKVLPILVHGYDYPVPDGRGFMGGWGPLPGPWLEPGFRGKGYENLQQRILLTKQLIDAFNTMIKDLCNLDPFRHVHYVDLRNSLQYGDEYRDWWANEMHPTARGFRIIAGKFADVLSGLP
jgi:hypothetical protein